MQRLLFCAVMAHLLHSVQAFVCPPHMFSPKIRREGQRCGGTCNSQGSCGVGLRCVPHCMGKVHFMGTRPSGKCMASATATQCIERHLRFHKGMWVKRPVVPQRPGAQRSRRIDRDPDAAAAHDAAAAGQLRSSLTPAAQRAGGVKAGVLAAGGALLALVWLGAAALRRQGSAHAGQHAVMSHAERATAAGAMDDRRSRQQVVIGVPVDAYELPDRAALGRGGGGGHGGDADAGDITL